MIRLISICFKTYAYFFYSSKLSFYVRLAPMYKDFYKEQFPMLKKLIIITVTLLPLIGLGVAGFYFFNKYYTVIIKPKGVQPEVPTLFPAPEKPSKPIERPSGMPSSDNPMLLGFTTLQAQTAIDNVQEIEGTIPTWLNGSFLSIGPGQFEIGESRAPHWLDGFAMIYKFGFNNGTVSYANRLADTTYYKDSCEQGCILGSTPNAQESTFSKVTALFTTSEEDRAKYDNTNINLVMLGNKCVALTETPHPITFDCANLKTECPFCYTDKLPGQFACAHMQFDYNKKQWINYTTNFARASTYHVYTMDEGTAKRIQLASIGASTPAYMHSFGLTKNYIILPEYPYQVSPLDLLLQSTSFIETFKWKPKQGTKFIVINRQTGKTVGTFKTEAFFALHQANAFELDDKTIVMDIVAYRDAAILTALKLDNLFDDSNSFPQGKLTRFTIDINKKSVGRKELSSEVIEMPRINYRAVSQKPYEFVYGAGSDNPHTMANQLVKINVNTGKALIWKDDKCYPAEPVFVASPGAKAEDDGIILSIVLDGNQQKSFALILDAKDFKEIGRAYVPHHIPFTVHGNFFERK